MRLLLLLAVTATACSEPSIKNAADAGSQADARAPDAGGAHSEAGKSGLDGSPNPEPSHDGAALDANGPAPEANTQQFISSLQVDDEAPVKIPRVTCGLDKASDLFALKAYDNSNAPLLGIYYFSAIPLNESTKIVTSTMLSAGECGLVLEYGGELYDGMKGGRVEHTLVGIKHHVSIQSIAIEAENGTIRTLSAELECDAF